MKYYYQKKCYTGPGYTIEARKVAEEVFGRPLPVDAEVHHVNGDTTNHEHTNLVICEDHSYHHLLHIRTDALVACGHANWRRCKRCQEYDDPVNLSISGRSVYHKKCIALYDRLRRAKRKEASVIRCERRR